MCSIRLVLLRIAFLIFPVLSLAQESGFVLPAGHHADLVQIGFSHDNDLILTGSYGLNPISIWEVKTGRKFRNIHTAEKGSATAREFKINRSDYILYVLYEGGRVAAWNYKTGRNISQRIDEAWSDLPVIDNITPAISKKDPEPDSDYFLRKNSLGLEVTICRRTPEGKIKRKPIRLASMYRSRCDAFHSNHHIIGTDHKGHLYVTNRMGEKGIVFRARKEDRPVFALSPDEKWIAFQGYGVLNIYNLQKREVVADIRIMNPVITGLKYSPTGNTLYMTYQNGSLLAFNYRTNEGKRLDLKGHVKFTPLSLLVDSMIADSVVRVTYSNNSGTTYSAIWNLSTNNLQIKELSFQGAVPSSKFGALSAKNPVYGYVSTLSGDGTITHSRGSDILFQSIFLTHSVFLHYTPEGYYYGNKRIFNYIHYIHGSYVYPFYQADRVFNRPDIVYTLMPQHDPVLAAAMKSAASKRITNSNAGNHLPDSVKISLSVTNSYAGSGREAIQVNLNDPLKEFKKLYVLVNGVDENLEFIPGKDAFTIQLSPGINQVEIFAEDQYGRFSNRWLRELENPEKVVQNLYLVSIGSSRFRQESRNLSFAAKDARDISSAFTGSGQFNKVFTKIYLDEKVKPEIMKEIGPFLKQAGKNDVVVVFFAGHGLLSSDLDYFLSAYDVDFEHPEKGGIPYAELENLLARIESRQKLLLMDACHSGGIDKGEAVVSEAAATEGEELVFRNSGYQSLSQNELSLMLSRQLFSSGSTFSGTSIIGASMGSQYAIERADLGNGVFTFAFINALKNKSADFNGDGKIHLNEVQKYVGNQVETLTNGMQKPTTRSENVVGNFRLR